MRFVEDGYRRLANAIIITAAEDYRMVFRKLKNNPQNKAVKKELARIEDFFHSDWYKVLTDVDGDMILRGLREEEWSSGSNCNNFVTI